MQHEDWEEIKSIAHIVAKHLHARLKSKHLTKIGIDEIREALDDYEQVNGAAWDDAYADKLEEQTMRRVVECAAIGGMGTRGQEK